MDWKAVKGAHTAEVVVRYSGNEERRTLSFEVKEKKDEDEGGGFIPGFEAAGLIAALAGVGALVRKGSRKTGPE